MYKKDLVDDFFDEIFNEEYWSTFKICKTPYNILKTKNGYEIQIAVAGYSKENITISIKNDILKLIAKANIKEDTDKKYLHKGLVSKDLTCSFSIPKNRSKVSSSYDNGLITIKIDVEETSKKDEETIEIK